MGVTIILCSIPSCGRMLNGELCLFVDQKPYCNHHAPISPTGFRPELQAMQEASRVPGRHPYDCACARCQSQNDY